MTSEERLTNIGDGEVDLEIIESNNGMDEVYYNVGQVFPGTETDYLSLNSEILHSRLGADGQIIYIRAYAETISAGKHYLIKSDADTKFISLYCDGDSSSRLYLIWFHNSDEDPSYMNTGINCPTGIVEYLTNLMFVNRRMVYNRSILGK
jgi:hypothetical protein